MIPQEDAHVKENRPSGKTMLIITMSKNYATGQIGGWRFWGWIVAYVKGVVLIR